MPDGKTATPSGKMGFIRPPEVKIKDGEFPGSTSRIFGRDEEDKYIAREDLPVLEKKDVNGNYIKNTILPRLIGKDWQQQFDSQSYLRSIYKFVPEIFSTGKEASALTINMIDNLTKSAENLRSQVRKNGLTTI